MRHSKINKVTKKVHIFHVINILHVHLYQILILSIFKNFLLKWTTLTCSLEKDYF